MTVYLQEAGKFRSGVKRPAVLVLPGGGYQYCSEREADPVALSYLKAGFQAFILRYSVGEDAVWPNPLDDYEQAMGLIRERAEEWNLYQDKIAVVGFSAGGHLAAAAAVMGVNRPNAAVLGYAVTGTDVRACCRTAPDTVSAVDGSTPPCFLFSSRTDNVVPVSNTIRFMQALADHDVAFESHIYAYGPHGFSTCDSAVQALDGAVCRRISGWVEDSIGWLKDVLGDFGTGGMTEPVCRWHMTDNGETFLSVDCTFGHLMGVPQARTFLGPILAKVRQEAGGVIVAEEDMAAGVLDGMKLRDMLAYAGVPEDFVAKLDAQLSRIPNACGGAVL